VTVSQKPRTGPRPLGLHLGLASFTLGSSVAALALMREGGISWMPELQQDADIVQSEIKEFDLSELIRGLGDEGCSRTQQMIEGIRKYHAHPYRRPVSEAPVIWQHGSASLLDYGEGLPSSAPVIFLVPSLVNRAYILDLMPGRSFVVAMAAAGIRPLLVDWGTPGERELDYSLDNYLLEVLAPALDFSKSQFPNAPLHLAGYCMGGTVAVALAQIRQQQLDSLITIAAPWDFHKGLGQAARGFLGDPVRWQVIVDSFNELPVDILQAFFASLDPNLCMTKFGLFNQMAQDSARAEMFVALEDWLNDGAPLVKKVALSCFDDWYGANKPVTGEWIVAGKKLCPKDIQISAMIVVPKSDKIVPPASALALARQLPDATVVTPGSGHIGMMVGSGAEAGLWQNVIDWVRRA